MKVVCGLGNPGPEYEATRHNLGWWVVDRLRYDWRFPAFRREAQALVSAGHVADEPVCLLKPLTYMNRSGSALASWSGAAALEPARDLLVAVDDTALPVGRVRFRPAGSAGGHNGLKSIEATLGTQAYARLRIGVGEAPPDVDRADWVLSRFTDEDADVVLAALPRACDGVRVWVLDGIDAAMTGFNG